MTLWITGATFCLIGMLLFTNALNQFGDNDRQEVASLSVVPAPKAASVEAEATEQGERQFQPTAYRPQAISPDQRSYEAPALTVPPSLVQQEELSSPSPHPEPIEEVAAAPPAEVLKVTANATVRNGPSTSAKKIGTVTPGTALQVKAREGNWVQFVDSSSGRMGWIHSRLVGPTSGSGAVSAAVTQADAPALAAPRPKLAKERIKQKPSAPIQASEQRPSRSGPPASG
jgi:hypothetical protein